MIQPFRTRSAVQADVVLWAKRIHMATHKANKKAVNEHSDLRFCLGYELAVLVPPSQAR